MNPPNWVSQWASPASAFATIVYTGFTIIIFYFIYRQFREMQATRHFSALLTLIKDMSTSEAVQDRRLLFHTYATTPDAFADPNMPEPLRGACERTLYGLSQIGTLLREGLLEEASVKDWLHTVPGRVWFPMESYLAARSGGSQWPYRPLMHMAKLGLECWLEVKPNEPLKIFSDDGSRVTQIPADELRKKHAEISKKLVMPEHIIQKQTFVIGLSLLLSLVLVLIGLLGPPFPNALPPSVQAGWLSAGLVSIGMMATGITSVGVVSVGVISVGIFAFGILSVGPFSCGLIAIGIWAVGRFRFCRRALE